MKRRLILLFSLPAVLTGCASAKIRNWRISPVMGPVRSGSGSSIGIRSIGLPNTLSQTGVPEPGGIYAANTFQNDLWAAPLTEMLQLVMVANLAQRLPNDTVLVDGGAIGKAADQLVEIQILELTLNVAGEIFLSAQFATRPATSQNWQFQNFQSSAMGGQTAEAVVAALSLVWGSAANLLATMLS
ncbi:MAG: membrane integrity-associated transporter subunit PqiC [Rhodospirillales bacterium]|nr:membrane integrity-associated transporter subunit PqiC [Rhodospirillales bacterium]